MPLVLEDRVRETTNVTGTDAAVMAGAVLGFQPFSVIGDGNTTYYCIVGQGTSQWEVGIGTYTTSTNSLSRDTILSSSEGGTTRVTFSSGVKDIFVTLPAEYAIAATGPTGPTGPTGAPYTLISSPTPPSNPRNGDEWIDTTNGVQYTYFVDQDGGQWVEFSGSIDYGPTGPTGPSVSFVVDDKTASYTAVLADNGRLITMTTGTFTVPASVFPTGSTLTVYNNSASPISVAAGAGASIILAGSGVTGTRTVAAYGLVTLVALSTTQFVVAGVGLV
jgi:hypothetical protein